jgi:hypothetical protein
VNYAIENPETPIGVAPKEGKTTVVKTVNHRLSLGSECLRSASESGGSRVMGVIEF